ncbi:hypothetical protein TRFO_33963 [Tritrichomonas foetus]|uniref:Uncharacterized protein n=1 Tax=Tritrichomonas foetus TaxID=1144522 RepID=A0A1J4JLJ5_9EUKA|nr:hypothetical protein TRFO_33963 [Tritrichomonas foetus]|eukprot:OHS99553.1 hypothetical protein TRFO_33963 [Tritrichomonas foetus]
MSNSRRVVSNCSSARRMDSVKASSREPHTSRQPKNNDSISNLYPPQKKLKPTNEVIATKTINDNKRIYEATFNHTTPARERLKEMANKRPSFKPAGHFDITSHNYDNTAYNYVQQKSMSRAKNNDRNLTVTNFTQDYLRPSSHANTSREKSKTKNEKRAISQIKSERASNNDLNHETHGKKIESRVNTPYYSFLRKDSTQNESMVHKRKNKNGINAEEKQTKFAETYCNKDDFNMDRNARNKRTATSRTEKKTIPYYLRYQEPPAKKTNKYQQTCITISKAVIKEEPKIPERPQSSRSRITDYLEMFKKENQELFQKNESDVKNESNDKNEVNSSEDNDEDDIHHDLQEEQKNGSRNTSISHVSNLQKSPTKSVNISKTDAVPIQNNVMIKTLMNQSYTEEFKPMFVNQRPPLSNIPDDAESVSIEQFSKAMIELQGAIYCMQKGFNEKICRIQQKINKLEFVVASLHK